MVILINVKSVNPVCGCLTGYGLQKQMGYTKTVYLIEDRLV